MQQVFDETGPNVQKVKAGVRMMAGNVMIVDVAFRMPSARKIVIRACELSIMKLEKREGMWAYM